MSKRQTPEAMKIRDGLKRMYVDESVVNGATRKRALLETEAEEWLQTIQEAKRAVMKSMGLEVRIEYLLVKVCL